MRYINSLFMVLLFLPLNSLIAEAKVNLQLSGPRTIQINGVIGDADNVSPLLLSLIDTKKTPVSIILNTPGGSHLTELSIRNTIRMMSYYGIEVNCYVPKAALSAGFYIFMECNKRYAAPAALLMYHPIKANMIGTFTGEDMINHGKELITDNETVLNELDEILTDMSFSKIKETFYEEKMWAAAELDKESPGFLTLILKD